MDLETIMSRRNWIVVGDTLNEDKYAYRIKHALLDHGYNVECVGKEKAAIDDVELNFDIVDLCIHPVKGLSILKAADRRLPCVLIQPGAGSPEIEEYLASQNIPFLNGCALKGLEQFAR